MSRERAAWVLPVSIVVALLLGLLPLPAPIMALRPYWLGLLMNTSATGLGGDCYGDSGGPKFLATNPGVVYATVTTGDYPCRATTWDYRTDTQSARAFLGQYVTLP